MISGPSTGVQITLQGSNQGIQTGMQNRTSIQIDDAMTAAFVVTKAQATLSIAIQRNEGSIAITESRLVIRENSVGGCANRSDSVELIPDSFVFPFGLARRTEVLQRATTAFRRQDARWSLPRWRWTKQRQTSCTPA